MLDAAKPPVALVTNENVTIVSVEPATRFAAAMEKVTSDTLDDCDCTACAKLKTRMNATILVMLLCHTLLCYLKRY